MDPRFAPLTDPPPNQGDGVLPGGYKSVIKVTLMPIRMFPGSPNRFDLKADQTRTQNARLLVVCGLPATRIVEVAARKEVSLVVMKSLRNGTLGRLRRGSITESVKQHATCPVLEFDLDGNPLATGGRGPSSLGERTPLGTTQAV